MPRAITSVKTGCLVILLSALAAANASAQGRCQAGQPPFATTAANRMKGAELRDWLPGKRIVAERLNSSGKRVNRRVYEFRADGSILITCTGPRGEPCTRFNPSSGVSRDVGVWKIDGDALVLNRTQFAEDGRSEARVTLHRQGSVYAAAPAGGPHFCLPGLIVVEHGG